MNGVLPNTANQSGAPMSPANATVRLQSSGISGSGATLSAYGRISTITSYGFTMDNQAGHGIAIETSSSTTRNTSSGTLAAGHYAMVIGSVNSAGYLVASYVASSIDSPPSLTLTGTYEGSTPYGSVLVVSGSHVPILMTSSTTTSGSITTGSTVTVSGVGSVKSAVLASSISGAGSVPDSVSAAGMYGSIGTLTSYGFTMDNQSGHGVAVETTSSTTRNTSLGTLAAGHYAIVVGSVNTAGYLVASYVASSTASPPSITLTGTYEGSTPYGSVLLVSGSHIPILTTSSTTTSGSIAVGATVTVKGVGSTRSAVLADSISAGGSDPSYPSTIAQKHLLTAEYLGYPDGSTTVSASQAARYLTWAQTGAANGNAYAAAGLKVQVYANPNHVAAKDPIYSYLGSADTAKTCAGSPISLTYGTITQYVMNPQLASMRTGYAAYVAILLAGQHVDAVFEDNAGPPGTSYGDICDYSESTWLTAEHELESALPYHTIFNGLSAVSEGGGLSPAMGVLQNPSTIGGTWEHCIADTPTRPEDAGWVWQDEENTQLAVTAEGKYFFCLGRDTTSAPDAVAGRTYAIASFLLTYNLAYSVLWEEYASPSGLDVMPESQLVPEYPIVATPSTVASLQVSTGVYVREYKACYLAGNFIGACAMVVNSDFSAHTFPRLTGTYSHTLKLSGAGLLDGGSASTSGPAPPAAGSTFAAESAYVLIH
jgi:hypothetical protein